MHQDQNLIRVVERLWYEIVTAGCYLSHVHLRQRLTESPHLSLSVLHVCQRPVKRIESPQDERTK